MESNFLLSISSTSSPPPLTPLSSLYFPFLIHQQRILPSHSPLPFCILIHKIMHSRT